MQKPNNGFLLVEALIAIVILSIVTATFLVGMAQALKIQDRANETTRAVLQFERKLYELETGRHQDLVLYGGSEPSGDYLFAIKSEEKIDSGEKLPSFYQLSIKLSQKDGRGALQEKLFAPEIKS